MPAFICWECNRPIGIPSAEQRYCPYCGFAYVSPCSHEACRNKPDALIFTGKSASCGVCGVLYRYDRHARQAVKTLPAGPFTATAGGEGAGGLGGLLVDFDPVAADYLQEQAFRLQFDASPVSSPARADRELTQLAAVQARHGRVYALTNQTGEIKAYQADTLALVGDVWRQTFVPQWQPNPAQASCEFLVTASLMLARRGSALYGFDAGRGGLPLFTLPLAENAPAFAAFNDSLLCVEPDGQRGKRLALYSAAALSGARGAAVAPLKHWEEPFSPHTVEQPSQRFLLYPGRAFLLDTSGSLFVLDYDTDKPRRVFDNVDRRRVVAWAGGVKRGVALLAPLDSDTPYSLVPFDPNQKTFDPDELKAYPLLGLRPHPKLQTLLLQGDDLYLLSERKPKSDEKESTGRFWRIPLQAIADKQSSSIPTLDDEETLLGVTLLPLHDAANPEITRVACVHTKTANRHLYHVVRLNSSQMADYGSIVSAASLAQHRVEVFAVQKGFVVANFDNGKLHYISYSKIMESAAMKTGGGR